MAADFQELKKGQEDAATKPYSYRKKGNEEQAAFNKKVQDTLEAAKADLEDAPASAALDKAKTGLEEGLKLLADGQKLIKLADRSDHGWGLVAEYTADELAENSDDEKRIFVDLNVFVDYRQFK